MKVFVKDLKVNDTVETVFLLYAKQLRAFRDQAKGKYLCLTLGDRTGQIEARIWDSAEALGAAVKVEDFVRVKGTVEEFGESRQLRVDTLSVVDDAGVQLADFLPNAAKSADDLARNLDEVVGSVRQPHLARLLASFFSEPEFRRLYLEAPAAKRIHHAYLGGLAEHSLEVAALVLTVARFTPNLDRDLAVTAALLHDLGKLKEYSYRRVIDLTDDGKLVGHTVLGYYMLLNRIAGLDGFPDELAQRLLHAILAHHGQMEWGAPVLPQTVEAAAVHHADLLSGRVKQYDQLAASGEDGERWSSYDSLLGRSILLPYKEAGNE